MTWRAEWKAPNMSHWSLSCEAETEEEARRDMERDMLYFYDDVTIRLVKVTKEVIEEHKGSHGRRDKQ